MNPFTGLDFSNLIGGPLEAKLKKTRDRILNTSHAVFYPRKHLAGNGGWPDVVRDMLCEREKWNWDVILHCPTCTVAGIWLWLRGK